jgi:hypothetical protein
MQNYLVYKADTADEINECSYSLLKYLAAYNLKPPVHQSVVIYTRHPALLESYASYFHSFEFREPEKTQVTRLTTLAGFFREYRGNVLYLDTNTYPVCQLESVFAEISRGIPHVLRWNPILPRKSTNAKDLKTIQVQGKAVTFNPMELDKWNDSVIGISGDPGAWLDEVLVRSIEASAQLPPALAEKWAFHDYLGGRQAVKTADHAIAQYDDLREFRNLLRKFFTKYQEESVPNQLKLIQNFDAAIIQEQKRDFQKLPLYRKLLKRITGKHWSIEEYARKV